MHFVLSCARQKGYIDILFFPPQVKKDYFDILFFSLQVKKGYVEVKLQKQDEKCDWTPMVKARGIDQLASDESS